MLGLFAGVVFTLIGAAFVVGLVVADARGSRLRVVAKPAASMCFLAAAVAVGALDSAYGAWVFVALVLSAIGDVALLGSATPAFLLGLGSFLLGHVAYTVGFAVRGLDVGWVFAAAALLAVPLMVVLRWLLPHAESMRGPVIAYAAVISAMVAAAAGTFGFDVDARILIGALAFYVSDLAVARDRFVTPGPTNRLWGLPLYYAAQFLLAWSAAT
ncbi:MAG: lysoplasmalogenase family protein [Ilumatobacter sp.]|uniref:lysoplasmalogenase family protein n=1 Tax=Ilumatobacter sp. TaxID=1967498 RepID=UPI00391D2180